MTVKEIFYNLLSQSRRHQDRGDYEKALVLSTRAVAEAEERGKCGEEIEKALLLSARNAYYLGRFEESLGYLGKAASIGQVRGEGPARIEALLVTANIERRKGLYRKALQTLSSVDDSYWNDSPVASIGEKLLIESACLYYLGRIHEARERLETALGIAVEEDAWKLRSRILIMSGLVMRRLGFTRKAADDYVRAADICRSNSDLYGMAAAGLDLGIVLYHEGRLEGARSAIEDARRNFKRICWSLGECRCLIAESNIADRVCDFDKAASLGTEALKMARKSGFGREAALALVSIARANFGAGRNDLARNGIRSALEAAGAAGSCADVISSAFLLAGEVAAEEGDLDGAAEHLSRALELAEGSSGSMEKGLARAVLGMVLIRKGLTGEGVRDLQEGRRMIRDSGSIFELARTALIASGIVPEKGITPEDNRYGALTELGLLLEARYLFEGTDSKVWKRKARERLERLNGCPAATRSGGGVTEQGERESLELSFEPSYEISGGLVAVSTAMQEVWNRIQFAASFSGPVLVTGETGTGKELVARMIHDMGDRASRPFVAVNCAAIPDHLFESEFFGHRKGCFTGASTDRKGFFEEAESGTLFLDEVGELSTAQQAKLLRVLQEGKVRRIGENSEIPIDIKVISATNQDVENSLERGSIRSDFYFRINGEKISLPPLRERPEDILPLVAWKLCTGRLEEDRLAIEREALELLRNYHWPGNVRELLNVIERIKHLEMDGIITVEMLPEKFRAGKGFGLPGSRGGESVGSSAGRRQLLEKAMTVCKGNKSAAARWLGISRGTLYKELKETGLYGY